MKPVDAFLTKHRVDIGRSLALLLFANSIYAAFDMLGRALTGHLHLNLAVPLGAIVGIALWQHASWSRTLLLVLCWATVIVVAALLVLLPFTGTAKLTLNVGSTVIKNPALWQAYVIHAFIGAVVWLILAALHSETAKAEFRSPHPAADTNRTAVVPPSEREPRHP